MDSSLNAAALALARGDVLGALSRTALRTDAPALAIQGTAMAQLGEFTQARTLLRKAARAFGRREEISRARCVIAEAEVALVSRDLSWSEPDFDAAIATLQHRGDIANASYATCIAARRHLLLGELERAEAELATLSPGGLKPSVRATWFLTRSGIHVRRLAARAAEATLGDARDAAQASHIPALLGEVEAAEHSLQAPAAFLTEGRQITVVTLRDVEALFGSGRLVLDTLRNTLRQSGTTISLGSRPVLFALLRSLGRASPSDVTREDLLHQAFGAREADESHRARLRVEMTRLRQMLRGLADIAATTNGYRLSPAGAQPLAILTFPTSGQNGALLSLLADGQLWSSSALSQVLQLSSRTVQRTLDTLHRQGLVQPIGHGRARRWTLSALPGFPTTLLL